MNPSVLVRVLLLTCVWQVCCGTGKEVRADQPTNDYKYQVHRAPGAREPGIKGCLPSPVPSYNVRVQSLKTSGGSVYTRQLVTTVDLPCFEDSDTKAMIYATSIANCAEATAKEGLNSFSWENGICTAYLAWRPQKRADCKDGGSKVVYVVQKPLTPFGGGKIVVSGKMNYDSLPKVFLDISHQYQCGFSSNAYKGYKLLINGSDVVMLPEGNATYSMSLKLMCTPSVNISLWSVGADGKVNSNEALVAYTTGDISHYYRLSTGECFFDPVREGSYLDSLQYCNSTASGTLYFAKANGGASAFLVALKEAGLPGGADGFYIGLRWVAEGQWEWLGGLSQPSNGIPWADSTDTGTFACANIFKAYKGLEFVASTNCDDAYPILCYFPNP